MFCSFAAEDSQLLAKHVRGVHGDKSQSLDLARAISHKRPERHFIELSVREVDIDRIYAKRKIPPA